MKILVTGSRGYIGVPLLLSLRKYEVIAVDNRSRMKWVNHTTGTHHWSGYDNYIEGDLTDRNFVNEILAIHKPDCIIHLASQPSMPYSQINGERALFTQINNMSMCLNLLWGIKENGLRSRFIITTTTGIPGQAYDSIPEYYTWNMAGSWYHTSRGFDSANCSLASRQWNQKVVEFRTSIVYGLQTELMRKHDQTTRFDTDYYFGTVLNRFAKQAIDKKPLTIYGKGEQMKPFISLQDTVDSIVNAIDYKFIKPHTILNQTTEMLSILDLANIISKETGCKTSHVPNPRKEKETHKMIFDNMDFLRVLGRPHQTAKEELPKMIRCLCKRR